MSCPDCADALRLLAALPDYLVPRDRAAEIAGEDWLITHLRLAVPLRIFRLKHEWEDTLQVLAKDASAVTATVGDTIGFGSKDPKRQALALDALVTTLAVTAILSTDGVTYRSLHWCTKKHKKCPAMPACAA